MTIIIFLLILTIIVIISSSSLITGVVPESEIFHALLKKVLVQFQATQRTLKLQSTFGAFVSIAMMAREHFMKALKHHFRVLAGLFMMMIYRDMNAYFIIYDHYHHQLLPSHHHHNYYHHIIIITTTATITSSLSTITP